VRNSAAATLCVSLLRFATSQSQPTSVSGRETPVVEREKFGALLRDTVAP
jgi:hypothetical protein